MGDNTHTLTIGSDANSGRVTVPAQVQREQGICIDSEVEVEISGLDGLMTQVAFVGTQVAGDQITVPAELVRKAEMDLPGQFDVSFDAIEDEEEPADESEAVIEDEDVDGDIIEEIEDEIDAATETEEAESETVEEESEEGLGELFA